MGIVYEAEDRRTGDRVALKVIYPYLASDPNYVSRLRREYELARKIRHPSLVEVYESGTIEGQLYLAMEFIPGQNLADRVPAGKRLPMQEALSIIRDMADALAALHARNIVHRDVKPSNIMFKDGRARLGDFGLAKDIDATGGVTLEGTFLGSLP